MTAMPEPTPRTTLVDPELLSMISENADVALHPQPVQRYQEIVNGSREACYIIAEEIHEANADVSKVKVLDRILPALPPQELTNDRGSQGGFSAISFSDLAAQEFADMHWNIEKILPAGTTLLFGKPKKGKSFLTLMIAISKAAGRPVFGHQTYTGEHE